MIRYPKLTVLVIDPQIGWLNDFTGRVFSAISGFVKEYDLEENTVISVFSNTRESKFRSLMPNWEGFRKTADRRIVSQLDFRPFKVYPRQTYGMPPSFWKDLGRNRTANLLITGVETDASIIKTAMDSFDRGISSWIITRLVGSTYGENGQRAGLAIARKVLGRDHVLESTQAFIAMITK